MPIEVPDLRKYCRGVKAERGLAKIGTRVRRLRISNEPVPDDCYVTFAGSRREKNADPISWERFDGSYQGLKLSTVNTCAHCSEVARSGDQERTSLRTSVLLQRSSFLAE